MWIPPKPDPNLKSQITRYRTIESRRIAVREALKAQPQNPELQRFVAQLTSPEQILLAAQKGVFINYSRHDEILALEIAMTLRQSGINIWLDTLDISFESDWHSAIKSAMMRCGLMLTILSPPAIHDVEARREREAFLNTGKLMMPIISSPCNLNGWDVWLPPVDFSKSFNQGMTVLTQMLSAVPARVH